MSTLTYLTNIVTSLTYRFNQLEANSKKVDELPVQTTLEPTSKIPVSRGGVSEYITAQQIISSIQNSNYNQLTSVGDITVDGTDIIVEPVSGQINGNVYATSTDTTIPITLCPTGFNRKDILVLTTSNTVIAISGEETDGAIVIAPLVPLDAIYITEFDVSDSAIGVTTPPIVGTQFKQKNESRKFSVTASGTDYAIELRTAGHQHYAVSGTVTSIAGFSKALITASPTAEVPYAGKDFYIENKTDHNVTLKNAFSPVDIPFHLGADLVVPTNGIVWLKYNPNTEKMDLFFKSWADPIDLSTKADLVGGKVPSSQLPSYVDDVVEGYFNGTNFYTDAGFTILITGESGKIYVALDTNLQYRWTGSAYVQIGGGEKQIFSTPGAKYNLGTIASCYSTNVDTGFGSDLINASAGNMPTAMGARWVLPLFISEKNQKLKEVNIRITSATFPTLRLVIFTGLSVNGSLTRINNQIIHDQNYTLSGSNLSLHKITSFTNNVTIPIGYDLCFFLIRVDGTTGTLSNFQISGYAS